MKLVDFLVEELHKFGGWPDGMVKAWQSNVDTEVYFVDDKNVTTNEVRRLYRKMINKKSDDMGLENAVTRSEYESALAAKNDGWINWNGGDCPLAKGDLIDFRLRGGGIHENLVVGEIIGERWTHSDSYHRASCDIIAYRLHKPDIENMESELTSKAIARMVPINGGSRPEFYASTLKELDGAWVGDKVLGGTYHCIKSYWKVEMLSGKWSGEGLPPIGAECVVTPHNSLWGFSSVDNYTGKVLAYDGEDFWFVMLGGVKVTSRTDKVDFSLPRIEEERKRELTIRNIATAVSGFMTTEDLVLAGNLYDAIANGKIEGVKLEGN